MKNENENRNLTGYEIAVIGMDGRFPGSGNIEEFWENLKNGKEGIRFFSDSELSEVGVPTELLENPMYIKAKGIVDDVEYFDSSFFNFTMREADGMDPQLRVLHESAWKALENAGYNPDRYEGKIGLYVGASTHYYWISRLLNLDVNTSEKFGLVVVNDSFSFSAQIAYRLNLRGPAMTLQTACSTSLVAIHSACQALLSGECDIALAGGVTVRLPLKSGYMYQEGMVHSRDGHNRSFDSKGSGTVEGNGVGVVVLKPVENALQDRDQIYAMVKGTAVNNDGNRKVGFSAPSVIGQAEVIQTAQKAAEVEPESITYVEAHGTATTLGDPVEIRALTRAFDTEKKQYCRIGSVKSNIGHLDAAAGVAGFIKTVLALYHRMIPPSLHFENPNPEIDFKNSPFLVNTKLVEWKNDTYPLRAGVSSFGIGGANAHVVLEEAPEIERSPMEENENRLVVISARTEAALDRNTMNLAEHLAKKPGVNFADAVYTLQVGRKPFEYRRTLVCRDKEEAVESLSSGKSKKVLTSRVIGQNPPVIFMFPGMGAQYVNMGNGLYRDEPAFRAATDRCLEILKTQTGYKTNETEMKRFDVSQANIFIFEYALARLLMKWGIAPHAMIGYSFGEYTAACISGVLKLEDALKIIEWRGKLVMKTQEGGMLSVPLPGEEITPLLDQRPGLSLAIDNGPSCIIAGPKVLVDAFEMELKQMKYLCMRLDTSYAIHTSSMNPILEEFEEKFRGIELKAPRIPYISNLTGKWIAHDEAVDPKYWSGHMAHTVRFSDGIQELIKEPDAIFLELGPGRDLSALIQRYMGENNRVINMTRPEQMKLDDTAYLLNQVGRLWTYGKEIDWNGYYEGKGDGRYRVSLPTYSFEKQAFVLESGAGRLRREIEPSPQFTTFKRSNLPDNYEAPRNELEQKIADAFQGIFGLDQIGIHDDFFELGGDSLKAITLVTGLHQRLGIELFMDIIFKNPTVEEIAKYAESKSKNRIYEAIPPVEKKEYYPVSSSQRRLYILDRMGDKNKAYNSPAIFWMEGNPDIPKFEKVFKRIFERHESLRTGFFFIEGEAAQRVFAPWEVQFTFKYHELKEDEVIRNKEKEIIEEFIQPFDLSSPPLWRVGAIRVQPGKYILMVNFHHIITDDISTGIMMDEMVALYREETLEPLSVQYKDYVTWMESLSKEDNTLEEQKGYWLDYFSGELPILDMPLDYPRPEMQSFEGGHIGSMVESGLREKLIELARENKTTLYVLFFTIYNMLLYRYTGQEDIIVGTPITGRSHRDVQQVVGMFVNTLALRNYPKGNLTFKEFLIQVKGEVLRGFSNQSYQFEDLVKQLDIPRDMSRNPIFDTMFVQHTVDLGKVSLPEITFNPYGIEISMSKFDITFNVADTEAGLVLSLEYNTALFKPETITRFKRHFDIIMEAVLKNPGITLDEIELVDLVSAKEKRIISPEDQRRILVEFNDTSAEYPKDKTIHELFRGQAEKTPEHIAVIDSTQQITYRELDEQSDRIAFQLKEKGVETDAIVAIIVERSIEMIVGIFGIVKSGAAYLPIDPSYPKERIDFMLKDSGAKVVIDKSSLPTRGCVPFFQESTVGDRHACPAQLLKLSTSQLLISVSSVTLVTSMDKNFLPATSLAYIIYTSGTTGKPKGAVIEHRSLVNRLNWTQKKYPLNENDTILQKTTYTFDVSVWEIFWWSIVGARVCLLQPGGEKDPEIIAQTVERNRVTTMHFVPSMLSAFLDYLECRGHANKLSTLKQVIASGEALLPSHVERFNELLNKGTGAKLANLYGPTEATIDVSYFDCMEGREGKTIPIGKPIDNICLHILDEIMQMMPIGIPGELCISGIGLARGYLNRPQLTSERFILGQAYLSPTQTLNTNTFYRTGDLAKWLDDGNIEFLGRIDRQVKIRGFRVELGEIENRLLKHKGIKEAVVVSKEDGKGDKRLVAYFVSIGESNELELREYLQEELPDYMIPSYFVRMDKMPFTQNGKIDKRALPEPEMKSQEGYGAPRNDVEEKLVEIWAGVLTLKKEQIGVNANFFQLGGHSLKAALLVSKIHKEFRVNVPLAEIFKTSTIRGLSNIIGVSSQYRYESIEPVEEKEYYELSSAQKRMYILQQANESDITYNMPEVVILEGELDRGRFEWTMKRLVERHESFRTSYRMIGREPAQMIHSDVEFAIEYYDFLTEDTKETEEKIHLFIRPFDLSQAPLVRVGLIRIEERKHILILDMSHIASDGVSLAIFLNEFMDIYGGKELPPLKIQYKDFSEWQNSKLGSEGMKKQERYWLDLFQNEAPQLELLYDYPPGSRAQKDLDSTGNRVGFQIGSEDVEAIRRVIREENVTLFMYLFTVYVILLHKLTWSEDIAVGTPVMGREHEGLHQLIGVFINTLVIRSYPTQEKKFNDLLHEIKQITLNSLENQGYPYDELVEKLKKPLFDTMFVLQNVGIPVVEIPGLILNRYNYRRSLAKFDLTFTVEEAKEIFLITIEYRSRLFEEKTIEQFSGYFKEILPIVTGNREIKLKDIEIAHTIADTEETIYDEASGDFGF